MAEAAVIFTYSAKKKSPNFIPEYSVPLGMTLAFRDPDTTTKQSKMTDKQKMLVDPFLFVKQIEITAHTLFKYYRDPLARKAISLIFENQFAQDVAYAVYLSHPSR